MNGPTATVDGPPVAHAQTSLPPIADEPDIPDSTPDRNPTTTTATPRSARPSDGDIVLPRFEQRGNLLPPIGGASLLPPIRRSDVPAPPDYREDPDMMPMSPPPAYSP